MINYRAIERYERTNIHSLQSNSALRILRILLKPLLRNYHPIVYTGKANQHLKGNRHSEFLEL